MNKYFIKKEGRTYFIDSKTAILEKGKLTADLFKKTIDSYQKARTKLIVRKYVIKQD